MITDEEWAVLRVLLADAEHLIADHADEFADLLRVIEELERSA